MKKIMVISACIIAIAVCTTAKAQVISHVPNDMVPPVVKTPAFGELVAGGIIGTAGIDFGVDYSYGGIEGIFDNGGGDEGAIGGINGSNHLDLLTDVDGAIVILGTTEPGVTSYLSVEAGHAADGSLLLEVFGMDGALLTSVVNGPPPGPHGRTTMTIDRAGVYDIAFFRVSTPLNDTYGVDQIDLETPLPIVVEVEVDIKPGSCPNPLNPKSRGVVPVAIVGTLEFDPTTEVVPESVTLAGVPVLKWEILDSTQPGDYDPAECYDCFNADDWLNCDLDGDGVDDAYCGDGLPDLVLYFDTQELVDAIDSADGAVKGDCLELDLEGEAIDGTPIAGSDSMVILKDI